LSTTSTADKLSESIIIAPSGAFRGAIFHAAYPVIPGEHIFLIVLYSIEAPLSKSSFVLLFIRSSNLASRKNL